MKTEDLSPYVESLSETELDSLYELAGESLRFRLECWGSYALSIGLLLAVALLARPAIHDGFQPPLLANFIFTLLVVGSVWLGMRALMLFSRRLLNRSVMRELRRRVSPGVT